MCRPRRPFPDHYDALPQVCDHFTPTPTLTSLPTTHWYRRMNVEIRAQVAELYRKHELQLCPRQGLYYAGPASEVESKTADKIMLMVVELKREDVGKWWKMDGDVRKILKEYELDDPHGICVRYYQFHRVVKVESARTRPAPSRLATASSRFSPTTPAVIGERHRLPAARSSLYPRPVPESERSFAPLIDMPDANTSSSPGSRLATPLEERDMVQLSPRTDESELEHDRFLRRWGR